MSRVLITGSPHSSPNEKGDKGKGLLQKLSLSEKTDLLLFWLNTNYSALSNMQISGKLGETQLTHVLLPVWREEKDRMGGEREQLEREGRGEKEKKGGGLFTPSSIHC